MSGWVGVWLTAKTNPAHAQKKNGTTECEEGRGKQVQCTFMKLPSLSIFDHFLNMMTRQETLIHHLQTICLAIIVMQFTMVIKFPAILLSLPSV